MSILSKIATYTLRRYSNFNPESHTQSAENVVSKLRTSENYFKGYRPPSGYALDKLTYEGLDIEFFHHETIKSDKVVYVLHGGGYIARLSTVYRWKNKAYSSRTGGANVLNIDYRVRPEFEYPAALEDAVKGYDWLISKGYRPENIVLAGDSAGGHLAVSLLMKLRDLGKQLPCGAVLISPWLDMTCSGESYYTNFHIDPSLGIKGEKATPEKLEILKNSTMYQFASGHNRYDPYISPVFADCKGFCPIYITVGGNEMILSDSVTLCSNMKKEGIECTLSVTSGMFHAFTIYPIIPESKNSFKGVLQFMNRVLNKK